MTQCPQSRQLTRAPRQAARPLRDNLLLRLLDLEDEQAALGAKHEKAIRALNAKLEDLGGQLAVAEAGWAAAEAACIKAQHEAATTRAQAAGKQRECWCQGLGFRRTCLVLFLLAVNMCFAW